MVSESLKIGNANPTTVAKEYTKVGRVSKLIYPSGRINTYTYDDNYLPQSISSNGEVVASYEFNTINAPTKKTLGNQVTLEVEYNSRQQATKHIWKKGSNIISGYHYGYDLVGNRIWSENQTDSQKSEHFTFDSIDRLTNYQKGTLNANQTGTVSPTYFQNWNLDNIGNWQLFNDNGAQSENQFNQVHAMTEFKGTTQIFDANGNLISDGVRSFIYDAFNRLIQIQIDDTIIAQYQYDTYNRRVSKTINKGTTHYLYDGFRCIEEQNTNGILEKEYVHGGLYIDEIILQVSVNETYYITHDYRYSVTSLTGVSGNTVTTYDYKVYGNREGDTALTDIGYTGQRHDPESGLMYFRNRYYNPVTGSFITKDPLGYIDGMSMYLGYFGGQGRDPFGNVKIKQGDILKFYFNEKEIGEATVSIYEKYSNSTQRGANIKIDLNISDANKVCGKSIFRWRQKFTIKDGNNNFLKWRDKEANDILDPDPNDDDKEWYWTDKEFMSKISKDNRSATFTDKPTKNLSRLTETVLKVIQIFTLELVKVEDLSVNAGGVVVLTINWGLEYSKTSHEIIER